ncbi:hypothetical protein [Mycolicibacterium nivoides]|uniref:Peptidase M1 membrane alanine aminopeptidase domain-containing protein n=1 Tax=Mycolicibacterium nivoides TaxID=2487344 RepID=A0ABW9LG81_9MYCO
METINFEDAPRPTRIGRWLLVPMHIAKLHGTVTIDAQNSQAYVDATMTYVVGPVAGNPFFDLRQRVERCWIDGAAVNSAEISALHVGERGRHSSVRVMRSWQHARSVHTLRVTYRLGLPMSDLGGAYPPVLAWLPGPRVRWSFGMADLYAGRYLEAWFPSNLPFDHFQFTLELTITGSAIPHSVVTNGRVTTTGTNRWTISFPPWFTTMSPLVELHAADTLQTASVAARLPVSDRPITISAWKFVTGDENLAASLAQLAALLSEQEHRFGAFGGDSYVCFFHGASGGMEYGNATTTSESALRHEVTHSWFARGLSPASQADGWWDEGFTRYLESGSRAEPLDFWAPPVELCSRRPFQRTTTPQSYDAGSRVFRGIAEIVGRERLWSAMRDLYRARNGTSVSTPMLEAHLIVSTGAMSLVDVFHRFVYGFGDDGPSPHLGIETVRHDDRSMRVRVQNYGAGICRHYVVAVTAQRAPIAVAAGFDLAPGQMRSLSLRWSTGRVGREPGRFVTTVHARPHQRDLALS